MSDFSSSSSENSRKPKIPLPPVNSFAREPYFAQRALNQTRKPSVVSPHESSPEDSQSRGEETARIDGSHSTSVNFRRTQISMSDLFPLGNLVLEPDSTKRVFDQTKKPTAVSPQESSQEISQGNLTPADASHVILPKDSESRSTQEQVTNPVPQEIIDDSTSEAIQSPPPLQAQSQENPPGGFMETAMADHVPASTETDSVPSDSTATKKPKLICHPKNRLQQKILQSDCIDSEKQPVVERENAAVLTMVMDALQVIPLDLSRNDDFIFQPDGNCIPSLASMLKESAVSGFDEEEKQEEENADSATIQYIDPAKSSRPYYIKFCEQIFSRLIQIKKMRNYWACSPLSPKQYRKTGKGYAQSYIHGYMMNGSCVSTLYSRPLFKDLFSIQHSFFRFSKEFKLLNDLHRVGDCISYGTGVDPLVTFVAMHDPDAEYYRRHPKETPNAAHFHLVSQLNLSKSKRISNSFRHIGIRMTLCLLDAQCGNRFVIPHKPISDTAVMEGKYPIGYKGRRNFKDEEPAWYELFDEGYLKNMILPDDFISRYASPDGSPVFSTGIFGTWSPGIKTQKMKIEADLNAADRLLAARHQLTNLPTESLRLPQHLLRRIAALHMSEHLDINEQTQFMNQCVGDGATPETKAATFLHVSQALRQGMGESYRYRRYLTGDSM